MTNKEKLEQMDTQELSEWLCDTVMPMIANKADKCTIEYVAECEICPVKVHCKNGKNGFRAWLEKEAH